jgi:hypothetical protein
MNIDRLRAMKIPALAVLGCLLLAVSAGAQVPNDACSSAQELDLIIYAQTCTISGQPSLSLSDSTDFAIPDFPYPVNPGACFGYWTVPNTPANDQWYKFLLPSGHYLEYTCTALDSLQLSWWQGYDCAFLTPLDCSTLLPGETIHRLRPGAYHPLIDTLYLQVSSTSVSTTARYDICYRDTWFGTTVPISYSSGTPTPVICLYHELIISPASDASSADGSVEVSILAGNGPYSILWADGSTDFLRMSLTLGSYPFTLLDGQNCQLQDTAVVEALLPTATPIMTANGSVLLVWDDTWLYYSMSNEGTRGRLVLMDAMARVLFTSDIVPGRHPMISLTEMHTQPWILLEIDADGSVRKIHRRIIAYNR